MHCNECKKPAALYVDQLSFDDIIARKHDAGIAFTEAKGTYKGYKSRETSVLKGIMRETAKKNPDLKRNERLDIAHSTEEWQQHLVDLVDAEKLMDIAEVEYNTWTDVFKAKQSLETTKREDSKGGI